MQSPMQKIRNIELLPYDYIEWTCQRIQMAKHQTIRAMLEENNQKTIRDYYKNDNYSGIACQIVLANNFELNVL